MAAAGAVLTLNPALVKLGYAVQESVRASLPELWEKDNSLTRDLQLSQAFLISLEFGMWSGYSRKVEISESFLQPLLTMLRRDNKFRKSRYPELVLDPTLDDASLEKAWHTWVDMEGFRRLAFRMMHHDAKTSMSLFASPLISYAEVQLHLPTSPQLWMASTPQQWKEAVLTYGSLQKLSLSDYLDVPEIIAAPDVAVDEPLSEEAFLSCVWGMAWEYIQMSSLQRSKPRRWNALVTTTRRDELSKLLSHFQISVNVSTPTAANLELLIRLELILLHLHTPFEDLQLFAGTCPDLELLLQKHPTKLARQDEQTFPTSRPRPRLRHAVLTDSHTLDEASFPYIFKQNATVTLKADDGLIRCNIYRPKGSGPVPVIVTYGPYGKELPYKDFHPKSFSEVNEEQESEHSAWETPDLGYWTRNGYAVVRADERGHGQSTSLLDTMSRGTSEAFFDVVEWAAEQPWSNGKLGLLGISYYAGSQWRMAARKPKGLAAIVPWEGMADYYHDRSRHGDTIEGDLGEEELAANRQDQTIDNRDNKFRDDPYYASKEYDMGDIEVPLLSVGNWGGILLHLRGKIEGYLHAGSKLQYLRMITGRHDLPFYYKEEVEVQRSFLDAFLKDDDRVGWSESGKVPPVTLVLRKGDAGFNDAEKEKSFPRREGQEWPIARTQYTRFHLTPELGLTSDVTHASLGEMAKLSYRALGALDNQQVLQFATAPFEAETEVTGHVTAHLTVSGEAYPVDVEIWPTNVIVEKGGKLVFEVSSGDTQGSGIFTHDDPSDKSPEKLQGMNHLHFGPGHQNYVTLLVIPQK
ncbi:hypothetical protein ACHAQH_009885 [Verticillium albo-atrum]